MIKENETEYVMTDLACESGRIDPESYKAAQYERRQKGGVTVERLCVGSGDAVLETGKEIGNYVTVSHPSLSSPECDVSALGSAVAEEVSRLAEGLTGSPVTKDTKVLVAGLGNRSIAPDALGSRCADKINATRHVKGKIALFDRIDCSVVSVIEPGVLGKTGIESTELIKSASEAVSPDLLVVVDAMAARKVSRLATTIQISDRGLSPGKGVGNRRPAVDAETVGVPTLSIGSPTVVDSSTMICDALREAGIEDFSPELKAILENGKSFFVTLNDSDAVIEKLSDVIAGALNTVFGTSFP